MVALILGKPDAVISKTERVETLVAVDNRGRAIAAFDGVGITYLAVAGSNQSEFKTVIGLSNQR
jgi:hypothetical protein